MALQEERQASEDELLQVLREVEAEPTMRDELAAWNRDMAGPACFPGQGLKHFNLR